MLITSLKLKCVRNSEELKAKGSKRSGWNKIPTTLNESNSIILTKYRRWKFMNLFCTWYVMESCLKGRSQRKWQPGMEKGAPLREETLTLGSESDAEERILGSETLSTSSRELSDISDSPVLHTVDTSTSRYGRKRTRVVRRPRQLRAMAEQEETRRKSEWIWWMNCNKTDV